MEYIDFRKMKEINGVKKPKSALGFERLVKICEAAEQLFVSKGFSETSIADICTSANMAIGTFYIYFTDKVALYRYLVMNYSYVIRHHLRNNTRHCKSRFEMEREGLKAFIQFGYNNPHCYKLIWGSIVIDKQLFTDYYTSFAEAYVQALSKHTDELRDGLDLVNASYVLMGIANFVGLQAMFEQTLTPESLEQLVNQTMNIIKSGMFKTPTLE